MIESGLGLFTRPDAPAGPHKQLPPRGRASGRRRARDLRRAALVAAVPRAPRPDNKHSSGLRRVGRRAVTNVGSRRRGSASSRGVNATKPAEIAPLNSCPVAASRPRVNATKPIAPLNSQANVGSPHRSGAPRVAYDAPTPAAATALAGFFDPDQETSDELARARRIRFSVVSLADAEAALPRLVGRRAKDVVVDLDLDAYATTSPGALALAHALPAEARLEMYRIAHDVCAFDGDHDFASPTDCAGRPLAPPRGSAPGALDALVAAARDAASVPWTDARAAAFAAVLARHEGAVLDVPRAEEKIAAFVGQPFFSPRGYAADAGRGDAAAATWKLGRERRARLGTTTTRRPSRLSAGVSLRFSPRCSGTGRRLRSRPRRARRSICQKRSCRRRNGTRSALSRSCGAPAASS